MHFVTLLTLPLSGHKLTSTFCRLLSLHSVCVGSEADLRTVTCKQLFDAIKQCVGILPGYHARRQCKQVACGLVFIDKKYKKKVAWLLASLRKRFASHRVCVCVYACRSGRSPIASSVCKIVRRQRKSANSVEHVERLVEAAVENRRATVGATVRGGSRGLRGRRREVIRTSESIQLILQRLLRSGGGGAGLRGGRLDVAAGEPGPEAVLSVNSRRGADHRAGAAAQATAVRVARPEQREGLRPATARALRCRDVAVHVDFVKADLEPFQVQGLN
jgi:hypothetical protein